MVSLQSTSGPSSSRTGTHLISAFNVHLPLLTGMKGQKKIGTRQEEIESGRGIVADEQQGPWKGKAWRAGTR